MISQTDVPLGPLFQSVYRRYRARALRQGSELRIVSVARTVRSEPTMLEQILSEALQAAIGSANGCRLLLGARYRGDHLSVELWGRGRGELLDGETPSGLVVAQRLAALLSHPVQTWRRGSGLFLKLDLPLATQRARAETMMGNRAGGRLVVVIDDEAAILEGLSLLLEAWGFEVIAAESEAAAIAKLEARKARPSVILADYRLRGGHTGTEAVRHICELFKESIPSFLITGETQPDRLKEAQASGLTVLQKPVQPPRLQSLLSQTIQAAG